MNNLLIRSAEKADIPTRQFHDDIFLFRADADLPFASRAPLDAPPPEKRSDCNEILFEIDLFRISKASECLYCSINAPDAPYAAISLHNGNNGADTEAFALSYFSSIASLDLSGSVKSEEYHYIDSLIRAIANYCGCLTDVNSPDESVNIPYRRYTKSSPYLAAALPTVCLLYRRLSALRGFNFKLIFPQGLPCLAFSARILSEGISSVSNIPECSALLELDNKGEITVFSKLVPDPDDDGEKISRLTLIISAQSKDPSGILHATEWRKSWRERLDISEIDIPGRF